MKFHAIFHPSRFLETSLFVQESENPNQRNWRETSLTIAMMMTTEECERDALGALAASVTNGLGAKMTTNASKIRRICAELNVKSHDDMTHTCDFRNVRLFKCHQNHTKKSLSLDYLNLTFQRILDSSLCVFCFCFRDRLSEHEAATPLKHKPDGNLVERKKR